MNVDNIKVNTQSSIRLELDKVLYFDPYKIEEDVNDADIIFITHNHYDHLDINSINKVKKDSTIIICPITIIDDVKNIDVKDIIYMNPYDELTIDDINIIGIPSYNNSKKFHPKSNNWLGYLIKYNNISYFIAGDTDKNEDNEKIKCDVAILPIGGYYTMDVEEAYELIKVINPKVVIPTHYGTIVGNKNDGLMLKNKLTNTNIEVIEKF